MDWVIHLGAISSTTERNVDKILKHNLEYSMKLLEMCDTMGTNFQYASLQVCMVETLKKTVMCILSMHMLGANICLTDFESIF